MATVTISNATAHNSVPQNLYTLETDQFDKVIFTSVGSTAIVEFDTEDLTVGSDISIAATGVITLQANVTYLLSATAETNNVVTTASNHPRLQWVDVTGDADIGPSFPMTASTTVLFTPEAESDVVVKAITADGSDWQYPAQLINTTVTVQAVSGYTV